MKEDVNKNLESEKGDFLTCPYCGAKDMKLEYKEASGFKKFLGMAGGLITSLLVNSNNGVYGTCKKCGKTFKIEECPEYK